MYNDTSFSVPKRTIFLVTTWKRADKKRARGKENRKEEERRQEGSKNILKDRKKRNKKIKLLRSQN